MGRGVDAQGLAGRILALLGERWPITVRDVAVALGARPDTVAREVRRLASQGLVVVEALGDETYVALSGRPAILTGASATDIKRRKERRPPPSRPRDEDDPAFG